MFDLFDVYFEIFSFFLVGKQGIAIIFECNFIIMCSLCSISKCSVFVLCI